MLVRAYLVTTWMIKRYRENKRNIHMEIIELVKENDKVSGGVIAWAFEKKRITCK